MPSELLAFLHLEKCYTGNYHITINRINLSTCDMGYSSKYNYLFAAVLKLNG